MIVSEDALTQVRRFYDQKDMIAAYDELYQRHIRAEEPLPVEES